MKTKSFFGCVLLFLAAGLVRGQQPAPGPQPGPDQVGRSFFPPELVIQNQEAIGLSDEQKTYLRNEIRQAQLKFTDWQWKLQEEMEKMVSLIKQPQEGEQ